ncbi:MAG: DUF4270 family protein [Ginsengibacter sp.]
MSKNQYKFAVSGILILFVFAVGCTKIDTTSLGENLIPAVDNIHTFDTTYNVIAVNQDSLQCDTIQRSALQPIGIIGNDPLFGTTQANVYVEMKPQFFPYNFPAADDGTIEIDSAVMVLQYSHTFGDTNQLQKINIYQLSDSFDLNTSYTSCRVLGYDSSHLLGEKSFYPWALKDSVHAYNEEAANQLRIPVSTSFAQQFITDSAQIFRRDNDFINYFKGYAIVPDATTGGEALNYFDFTTSHLSFYIRYKKGGTADTTVINFALSGSSGLANSIVHDYSGAEIANYTMHPASGDSLLFIQTSPGNSALLNVPALSGLSNRVINKAEIIVDQVYDPSSLNDVLYAPQNLYLEVKDSSISQDHFIPAPCDFTASEIQSGFQYLGGQKIMTNSSGQPVAEYHLNITRYVQSVITKGKHNLTLRLSAPFYVTNKQTYLDWCGQGIAPFSVKRNDAADGRVVLNGTNNTTTHIRLHVVYTTL